MMFSIQLISHVYIVLCMWLMINYCIRCGDGRQHHHATHFKAGSHRTKNINSDIRDKIVEWQCYAKCDLQQSIYHSTEPLQTCRDQCKYEMIKLPRPGFCPVISKIIFKNIKPLQELTCYDNCKYDFDCPEVQKCCESSCGPVCMNAIDVREDNLLPPIPKILGYKLPRGHKVEVTIESSANSTNFFHFEIRQHIGGKFASRKFGMWHWQPVNKIAEIRSSRSKRTDVSFNVKPNRWYQVRVASINANGFRGYSEPSTPFTLSNPKPPRKPSNLKIISMSNNSSHFNITIAWCPSKSNLPIEKYKVIWSLYSPISTDLFRRNEAFVKGEQEFEIVNLKSGTTYHIQVQAISTTGKKRFRSELRSIIFNTSTASIATTRSPLFCELRLQRRERNFEKIIGTDEYNRTVNNTLFNVRFRLHRKLGMIVQISRLREEKILEICTPHSKCEPSDRLTSRVKKDTLEISHLKFNTVYTLKGVQENNKNTEIRKGLFTFITPKCENFRKRFPKVQFAC